MAGTPGRGSIARELGTGRRRTRWSHFLAERLVTRKFANTHLKFKKAPFAIIALAVAGGAIHFLFGHQPGNVAQVTQKNDPALVPTNTSQPGADATSAFAKLTPTNSQLLSRLASGEHGRWLNAWNGALSRMHAAQLWQLASDAALSDQVEAKALRENLIRGCIVSSSEREYVTAKPGLVDDWCRDFQSLGGTEFLREQLGQLMHDPDLLSASSHVLGPRKFRGTEAERHEELAMLEGAFRTAADPWTLQASLRSLWQYQSPTLLADWSAVNALSRFQQSRLGYFVASEVVCRSTADCDSSSPWLVELCASMPGLVCASGSSMDALISQNLSPVEIPILREATARALSIRREMAQGR